MELLTSSSTMFAPAARASSYEVEQAARAFEKETQTKFFLNSMPVMVMVLNKWRQCIFANDACLQFIGQRDESKILGLRPGEIVRCTHSDAMEGGCGTSEFCRTCGAVKAILTSLSGAESVQECHITLKNGTALDLRVWARPLQWNGETYSIFSFQDISHEKRREALERVFFHDIMNTASIISMSVEALKLGLAPDDAAVIVGDLTAAAGRLIDEINAERNLIAAENGELNLQLAPLNVAEFLQQITSQFVYHTCGIGKTIEVVNSEQPREFVTDRALLSRILSNLVKNALEASERGTADKVACSIDEDTIMFEVHNAAYMPHRVQLQVFNRSFSTKGAGRGLGTYSVRLLTERYLGGMVGFTSSPDEGTTFYVTYPLHLPKAEKKTDSR